MTQEAGTSRRVVVEDLWVTVGSGPGRRDLIRGLDLDLEPDTTLGLLGPSGAGKTVTALSILGLPPGGRDSIRKGSIRLGDLELTTLREAEYRRIRGAEIAMVFQDPGAALTPVHRIGRLVTDTLRAHFEIGADEAEGRALGLLSEVGFRDPAAAGRAFIQELSGGMRQRAMIALALAAEPSVLIADEPTSALDAIAQDEILRLLDAVRSRRSLSILLISHDPYVIDRMADRTVTIEDGALAARPRPASPAPPAREADLEPAALSCEAEPEAAAPSREAEPGSEAPPSGREAPPPGPALELRNLCAAYPRRSGWTWRGGADGPDGPAEQVLTDVSLRVMPREILGLVGESGCGKTTLARCALRILDPSRGQILLEGNDISSVGQRELRPLRRRMAAVFQNPGSSLNPRHDVARILESPLVANRIGDRAARRRKARGALDSVGLDESFLERRPSELSGGQKQRVALARALVVEPRVLICDEPFTALDLPLRGQLTELLLALQRRHRLACLFIAHDLEVIGRIADRVAVMRNGRIIESGPAATVLGSPAHRFTRELIAAGPALDRAIGPQQP